MTGRPREEIMDGLPEARRRRIEARVQTLLPRWRGLREIAGRSQEQIAQSLGAKQPSVLKMERQADLNLSTLRRFFEAAAGTLECAWNCLE